MIHLDRDPADFDDMTPSEYPQFDLSPGSATLCVVGGILLVLAVVVICLAIGATT